LPFSALCLRLEKSLEADLGFGSALADRTD
jgi:hypothetical protein